MKEDWGKNKYDPVACALCAGLAAALFMLRPAGTAAAAAVGFGLDLLFGDPRSLPHPVCAIGSLIGLLERRLRAFFPATCRGELAAGRVLAFLVPVISGTAALGICRFAESLHPALGFAVSCLLSCQMLAARDLYAESMKVHRALISGDVEGARQAVSMIVGRDTEWLDAAGITRAAVETVAENTSDGVIAPLFWLFLFGPVGGVVYKSVNTMDSMIGYTNRKYVNLGRTAAKLDDLFNWLPSRLSALFLIAAAWLMPDCSGTGAFRIWRRDRRCHASPNSAQGEAACAGALGVRLAGNAWYFGELHEKPYIGDDSRPIEPEDIRRANRLMYTASVLALAAGCVCACIF